MRKRITKAVILEHAAAMADALKAQHGFDESNGWNQVLRKPIETVVDYGRFLAYLDLIEEFD